MAGALGFGGEYTADYASKELICFAKPTGSSATRALTPRRAVFARNNDASEHARWLGLPLPNFFLKKTTEFCALALPFLKIQPSHFLVSCRHRGGTRN
jgi:hypothetical protein